MLQGDKESKLGIHYEFDMDSRPLGEGGMGIVYRGVKVDEKTGLRTDVAIKVLHEGLPSEVYARAEREASIQIRHINLIQMYGLISEYATDKYGVKHIRYYVISELLHGVGLSDLLDGTFINSDGSKNEFAKQLYERYLEQRKAVSIEIIKSIASGVMALHDKGFIHRDIDPSNIMVTTAGDIKLIDFGIAKNIKFLDKLDGLTATGQFIGKAEYASPELVLGDVKSQNSTTDIYALGILLFRLLTGRLPFTGSQYQVLQLQLKKKVPTSWIEDAAIADVVKKATQKNQSSRYSSIAEFRVDLDRAAVKNRRRMPNWVYGTAAGVAVLVLVALVWNLSPDKGDTVGREPDQPQGTMAQAAEPPTPRQQFEKALTLLDSDEADSVKLGFEQMKVLAADYDSAKVELGLTYFPYIEARSEKEEMEHPILRRRKLLNLTSFSDADSVLKYLNQSPILPPEASYALGFTYYKKQKKDKAIDMFEQAKSSLNTKGNVGHGYDKHDLENWLNNTIYQLQSPE